MNLYFHKLLLNALKAVCFSVFVVKFYQKMIHHTFRYTTVFRSTFPPERFITSPIKRLKMTLANLYL